METLSWIQYILESGVCMLTFGLFYYLFLSRETFFQFNRFYLLMTPLLALVIPALSIKVDTNSIPASLELLYSLLIGAKTINYHLFNQVVNTTSTAFSFSISGLGLMLYPFGVAFMFFRLIYKLKNIIQVIYKGSWKKQKGYILVETEMTFPTASFFRFLIWNKSASEEENQCILTHELAHIQQGHSFDNLLIEMWLMILWFNPSVYWFKKELRMVHEFIADEEASENSLSVYSYALLLVKHNKRTMNNLFSNFSGLMKERLLMLNRKQSYKQNILKYLLFIPVLLGLILFFSFNMVVPELVQPIK